MEELVDVPRIEPSGVDDSPDGPSPKHIQPNYCVGGKEISFKAMEKSDLAVFTTLRLSLSGQITSWSHLLFKLEMEDPIQSAG